MNNQPIRFILKENDYLYLYDIPDRKGRAIHLKSYFARDLSLPKDKDIIKKIRKEGEQCAAKNIG